MPRLFRRSLLACSLLLAGHLSGGVLDTAPGAKAEPNSALAPTTAAPAVVAAGADLLPSGDFSAGAQDNAGPGDWDRTGEGAVTWKSDSNVRYFHLVAPVPNRHVQLYRILDIPAGVNGLEILVRYRVAGLKTGPFPEDDARTILEYLDSEKKPMGAPPPVIFDPQASAWTIVRERVAVPNNARYLAIMPCLFQVAAGTLDLAGIQVTTLSPDGGAAIRMETARVDAERMAREDAILKHDLVALPKSRELHVSGTHLVTADGGQVRLQGVNICNLPNYPGDDHRVLWSIHVALADWHANVIRMPVTDGYWFGKGENGGQPNDKAAYRALADNVIRIAAGKGAYVIFDLHRYLTPDASCVTFWKDAAAHYANNPAVLFDILNEPHDTSWEVWRNGGAVPIKGGANDPPVVQSVGMQALVDAVRGAGAKNIIVAGGLEWAFDLTDVVNGYALDDKGGSGIMYSTHFYDWHSGWSKHFMAVAKKYPLIVGECGADITKMDFIPLNQQEDPYTWAPDAIGFIQKNHLNWTAWCFHIRATPDLLLDWEYSTPTPFWGAFVKDALSGRQFVMKRER